MPSTETPKSDLKAMRAERAARLAIELAHLPTNVDGPFFTDLQARWTIPPTIASPISQLCTTSQFHEANYERICRMMAVKPRLHRKQWEFVYIIRCIENAGLIAHGRRGLAFGVGREKLPSVFVAGGCKIQATDLPSEEADGHWLKSNEHSNTLDNLVFPNIVDRDTLFANASFRAVNMNNIPADLTEFDFCWSSCALEHLGSLDCGLDFIRNSLRCLNPGGIAVHTTEFNLGSSSETLENGSCVVYRESDLLAFAQEMRTEGHEIVLNLNPGHEPADFMIDRDKNADIHLRLYVANKILATSMGLCIKKAT